MYIYHLNNILSKNGLPVLRHLTQFLCYVFSCITITGNLTITMDSQ